MNRLLMTASVVGALALAACGDSTTDDVVQAPAPGAAPVPVTETRAAAATTTAAVAFGMTREQLEDADLYSADMTDLGDVEALVLNAAGELESVVVELEGPGDRRVVVPLDQLSSITRGDDRDLTTPLSAAQLAALPAWTGAASR